MDNSLAVYLEDILRAADKAANLVKSLLAFSRKQITTSKQENLNEIVRRTDKFLRMIIGEDIVFKTVLADKDLIIMADSGQIEQVLMNLVTNARDAMPNGGTLTIRTERLDVVDEPAGTYLKPGAYAVISVSDTGKGMDEGTRQRIFEPFFTTKERDKGTGLGLSMVYGIIQQHNGELSVYSEPGKGTVFKIYLQLVELMEEKGEATILAPSVGGTETILVAEDDADVRRAIQRTLVEFGYTVIEAIDGEDAVGKFMVNSDKIQLLILDVVMPKKNGNEAYEEIQLLRAGVPVLFTSGYPADIIKQKGFIETGVAFISKPVTPRLLLATVRDVLSR